MSFDPEHLLRTLNRHGVAYVLVGGFAAVAHGSSLLTEDVDIAPARDRANLDRLAAALGELGAASKRPAGPRTSPPFHTSKPWPTRSPAPANDDTASWPGRGARVS